MSYVYQVERERATWHLVIKIPGSGSGSGFIKMPGSGFNEKWELQRCDLRVCIRWRGREPPGTWSSWPAGGERRPGQRRGDEERTRATRRKRWETLRQLTVSRDGLGFSVILVWRRTRLRCKKKIKMCNISELFLPSSRRKRNATYILGEYSDQIKIRLKSEHFLQTFQREVPIFLSVDTVPFITSRFFTVFLLVICVLIAEPNLICKICRIS